MPLLLLLLPSSGKFKGKNSDLSNDSPGTAKLFMKSPGLDTAEPSHQWPLCCGEFPSCRGPAGPRRIFPQNLPPLLHMPRADTVPVLVPVTLAVVPLADGRGWVWGLGCSACAPQGGLIPTALGQAKVGARWQCPSGEGLWVSPTSSISFPSHCCPKTLCANPADLESAEPTRQGAGWAKQCPRGRSHGQAVSCVP